MAIKAVQQFMLGTVMNKEAQAADTMKKMKAAGYDGIELCGFMIHPSSFMIEQINPFRFHSLSCLIQTGSKLFHLVCIIVRKTVHPCHNNLPCAKCFRLFRYRYRISLNAAKILMD